LRIESGSFLRSSPCIQRQDVERIELHGLILFAGMQAVEDEQHRLAVDDELALRSLQRRLDVPRKASRVIDAALEISRTRSTSRITIIRSSYFSSWSQFGRSGTLAALVGRQNSNGLRIGENVMVGTLG
jgi:hypothetical protein